MYRITKKNLSRRSPGFKTHRENKNKLNNASEFQQYDSKVKSKTLKKYIVESIEDRNSTAHPKKINLNDLLQICQSVNSSPLEDVSLNLHKKLVLVYGKCSLHPMILMMMIDNK